jgi:hypothetical protein
MIASPPHFGCSCPSLGVAGLWLGSSGVEASPSSSLVVMVVESC